jgi:Domain of unknown function (DUF4157)
MSSREHEPTFVSPQRAARESKAKVRAEEIANQLASASGTPMVASMRQEMEPRFAVDFSNVLVHHDVAAAAATGFEPPAPGGRAPTLRGVDPAIPREEGQISLDHIVEKAQGSNWQRALDADNLRMEFSRPNTEREVIQMRHPALRPAAPAPQTAAAAPNVEPASVETP